MIRSSALILVPLTLMLQSGCGSSTPEDPEVRAVPLVVASFYPLEYFARRIGADRIDVECYSHVDLSSVDDLARIRSADLILLNGAGRERWTQSVSLPMSRVVDTSSAFHDRHVRVAGVAHSHGSGPDHVHESIDPHTWLDPHNANDQALAVMDALVALMPEHSDEFHDRFSAVAIDLESLRSEIRKLSQEIEVLFASDSTYTYLDAGYDLRIVDFDLDPARPPTDEQLAALSKALASAPVRTMLWPSSPCAAARDALEALGLKSVVFSPCKVLAEHERTGGEDYISLQRANLARLAEVLNQ